MFYPLQQRKPAFPLDSRLTIVLKLRVAQYVSTKNNDNGRCEMVSAKADFLLASYEARKSVSIARNAKLWALCSQKCSRSQKILYMYILKLSVLIVCPKQAKR